MSNQSNKHRVVITGLGVISSLGIGWQEFWKNLLAGKSGISKVETFDTSKYTRHFGGEVKNFDPLKFMTRRRAANMGRSSQMAVAAARLAVEDAGLSIAALQKANCGVCMGTTMGEPQNMESLNDRCHSNGKYEVDQAAALKHPMSNITRNIAFELGLNGQTRLFANACAAGNFALGYAFDQIQRGKAGIMLAGGADAFSRIAFTGFSRMLSMAPEKCQPFDKDRKGMMLAEGAGVLTLESLEHALARKAPIYAEVLGYGVSSDAHHVTIPKADGVEKSVRKALKHSGISSEEVGFISAHGTGTGENDRVECSVFNKVLGSRMSKVPVNSIKSMLGHSMGASSALESIMCCLVLKDGKIPPTINVENQAPECAVDCVKNKAREAKVECCLNNSLAFGGNNGCVVIESCEGVPPNGG